MNFCKSCRNLLTTITGEKLEFKCHRCGEIYAPTKESTELVHVELKKENTEEKYKQMIANAAHDAVNTRVVNPCKCGHRVVSMVRVGDNQVVLYICPDGHIYA